MQSPSLSALLAAVALAAVPAGCAAPGDAPPVAAPAAPSGAASCAALPDVTGVSPSVQAQIQRRRAELANAAGGRDAAAGALGMILMAATFPAAAEACFREAAALAPDEFRWPYYLGHLHRDAGALAAAAASFEQALRLRPDDVAALIRLGEVRLDQGRPAAADSHFARALSVRPDSLAARFGIGRAALQQADYPRAVAVLEEILARDPTAVAAHYPLGLAYRGLGDAARAGAHLQRRAGAGLAPADPLLAELDALLESPRAYETRGNEALDRRAWSEAADLFRRGLALDPDNPALRHRLGTALYLLGDEAGARAAFERVTRDAPTFPAAYYSLGVLLQAAGRHAEAIDRFRTALRYQPTDGEVRLGLASSLRRTGAAAAALAHYRSVLRMDAGVIDARFGAAMALVQLQRYREARDRLAAGMDAFPDAPIFPHALARLLAAAPDDQVRNGRRALRLVDRLAQGERTIDLGETMAMTLAELGRYGEAAAVQRDLIAAAEAAGMRDVTPRLHVNLRRYERGEPCRMPWPENAIP